MWTLAAPSQQPECKDDANAHLIEANSANLVDRQRPIYPDQRQSDPPNETPLALAHW